MLGLSQDKGITTGRLRWSRMITNEGQDQVVAAYPIPGGSTVRSIYINNLFVGHESMDFKHATIIGLHGFLVSTSQPYHGYTKDSRPGLDNMWDDMIPKDRPVGDSLTDYNEDSLSDDDSQDSDVTQSPVTGNMDELAGSELNIAQLNLTAATGPECVFARERRLDVTNGLIAKEQEYRVIDKVQTTMNKNYYLDPSRYWWLMFGLSTPKIEVVNELDWHPDSDFRWNMLAYPELNVLETLLNSTESDHANTYQKVFGGALESYFIDGSTYEDLGNASGLSNATNYCDIVVKYKRPRFEGLRADVQHQVG